jgi:DnaJ homolog subfamily C member 25
MAIWNSVPDALSLSLASSYPPFAVFQRPSIVAVGRKGNAGGLITMKLNRIIERSFALLLLLLATEIAESTEQSTEGQVENQTQKAAGKAESPTVKDEFDASNEDWGSYYDPKSIFCGKYDCYKVLGFEYESFGKVKPSTKEITQRFRKLSRVWHPDKSKHKEAKERFVRIARAYEVLTTPKDRAEYDFMRYNQEAYFQKYGSSVLWSYAPKTDTTVVILLLFIIGNIASWYAQKHRWQKVADRLIKAAVEDWTPREGGTPESKQLREQALAILAEQEAEQAAKEETTTDTNGTASSATKSAKKKAVKKVPGRGRKKVEQEALVPIVTELVDAMHDFGGGFHKPTAQDLLVVTMAKLPIKITKGIVWQVGYWIRRFQNLELNDEECAVLTERAVGVTWQVSSEEEREEMIKRELWIMENLVEWKEEQEVKNLSAAEQKIYNKLKKKGKLDKLDKLE